MNMNNSLIDEYSFTLEHFSNNNIESEYLQAHLSEDLKCLRLVLPVIVIFYSLFIIPDYLNNNSKTFSVILALRTIVLIFTLILYFKNDYFTEKIFYLSNTIYECIFISSFLLTAYIYNSFVFVIQFLWMIILIIGIFFLIPNKLINKIIIALITSNIFYLISFLHHFNSLAFLYPVLFFTIVLIILCTISVYHTDRFKRVIFLEQKKFEEISIRDPLTNIYNKRKFLFELDYHIEHVKRYNSDLSLIVFDIDNFKDINDKYGHLTGDKVLIATTNIINELIREVDIFTRIGGEEFAIILPHTALEDAKLLANRLCQDISNSTNKDLKNITCSFGVAQFFSGDTMQFFDSVDKALYKAKKTGKNKVIANSILEGN